MKNDTMRCNRCNLYNPSISASGGAVHVSGVLYCKPCGELLRNKKRSANDDLAENLKDLQDRLGVFLGRTRAR